MGDGVDPRAPRLRASRELQRSVRGCRWRRATRLQLGALRLYGRSVSRRYE